MATVVATTTPPGVRSRFRACACRTTTRRQVLRSPRSSSLPLDRLLDLAENGRESLTAGSCRTETVFRGVTPLVGIDLIVTAVLFLVPPISLYLPSLVQATVRG
jgi:hypothetical protein